MTLSHSISAISLALLLSSLLVIASAGGYAPYPNVETPQQEEIRDQPFNLLGIQGLIYCKKHSEITPIEGAVARIKCLATDEHGYERAPFSILSDATDAKGYFFATLSPLEVKYFSRLKECKAFLELSPSGNCSVPTNINNGITGALLTSYRPLSKRNMILFSVPPFYFTPETQSISNGY
ncbi:Pollen Ole e 1 allergen/extensin [Melia azedarach]|uniref:Pollen Ole e 1 allergen/extensin n=1 Tax=Melia azedarach TaxID=155640 RepID=A0ACC1YW70_MELAZ|nr:Pollen Ole e 1 allergen/extensin [Melia azedarach]